MEKTITLRDIVESFIEQEVGHKEMDIYGLLSQMSNYKVIYDSEYPIFVLPIKSFTFANNCLFLYKK